MSLILDSDLTFRRQLFAAILLRVIQAEDVAYDRNGDWGIE